MTIEPLSLTMNGKNIEKPAVQHGIPVSYGLGVFKSMPLPAAEDRIIAERNIEEAAEVIIAQTPCKKGPTLFWEKDGELRSVTAVLFPADADLIECMRFFTRCTSFPPEHLMNELLRVADVRQQLAAG